MSKSLTADSHTIKFQIWDTAGQERVSRSSIHPGCSRTTRVYVACLQQAQPNILTHTHTQEQVNPIH